MTADPKLAALLAELKSYPAPLAPAQPSNTMIVPFKVRIKAGVLSFFSTTMVFGSPVDVTLSELAIEFFWPADKSTVDLVKSLGY